MDQWGREIAGLQKQLGLHFGKEDPVGEMNVVNKEREYLAAMWGKKYNKTNSNKREVKNLSPQVTPFAGKAI